MEYIINNAPKFYFFPKFFVKFDDITYVIFGGVGDSLGSILFFSMLALYQNSAILLEWYLE